MKSPGLAAFLTLLFPGLGQIYSGRWLRGLACGAAVIAADVLGAGLDRTVKTHAIASILILASYLAVAWDAYACAAAAAAAEEASDSPSRLLLWSWTAVRAAILVPVVFLCLFWIGIAAASAVRGPVAVLPLHVSIFVTSGFGLWLAVGGIRRTYRAARGAEVVPAAAMREWLGTIAGLAFLGGLLIAIVLPSYSQLFRKSAEGRVKGDLASLRAAVDDYRKTNGSYPLRLEQVTRAGAMTEIPMLWPGESGVPHEQSRDVVLRGAPGSGDSGHWGYVADKAAPDFGRVYVDCTHTDTRGRAWSSY